LEGVPSFTNEENEKIRKFKIPGEYDGQRNPQGMFARKPAVNVRDWYADHDAKLKGLERAEKPY
jgi:hypothetical protein